MNLGDGFSLDFSPDMLSTAVTAPASTGSVFNLDAGGLISTLKNQAPGFLNSYIQSRVAAITKPKAPQVMQAPAPAMQQKPGISMQGMVLPAAAVTMGVIGLFAYSEKKKGGSRGSAR